MNRATPLLVVVVVALSGGRALAGAAPAGVATGAPPVSALLTPDELVGAVITDKLGSKVPMDVPLVDDQGNAVTLGQYFKGGDDKRPVLLTLGYYQCPMLCSMVLNGVVQSLKQVSLLPGRDYRLVSVSIDARDTTSIAAGKRAAYLKDFGKPVPDEAWRFHTATAADSKRLADSIGFGYRWDEKTQQFSHAAGIFFVSPDGVLTRTVWGLDYRPADVKFALMDASQGVVGTVVDKVLLTCFQYSTSEHKYTVYVVGIMRIGAFVTVLFVAAMLFAFWRRERARGTVV